MPIPSSVPWGSRLREVLGATFSEISREHIAALVDGSVREAADLDFKGALYGDNRDDRRELCKDIAAMRNDRGGIIVLGVADEGGVAVACPGVALSDEEERRMRQIVASGTAPHAAFEIQRVDGEDQGTGFYLLIAPPSSQRPHAIVVNEGLRYPRRDGSTTRYMSEVEVADMYRSRFGGEADQTERLERIAQEARTSIDGSALWLVVALAPNDPGALPMSFDERAAVEAWINSERAGGDPLACFREFQATVGVNGRRYTTQSVLDQIGEPARWEYAECHSDGAAAYARFASYGGETEEGQPVVVLGEALTWNVLSALRFVGRAAQRAGVYGDVAISAELGHQPMKLGFWRFNVEAYPRSRTIDSARSRHTVPLDALLSVSQDMLRVARLLLNDFANAFGLAEIRQLAADGTVRLAYFQGQEMAALAQANGLPTTHDQPA